MQRMPFQIPLERPVSELAAGEKQKLEIVKQLYLGRSFLVLDEPTSVLTPAEADEMLGIVRGMTERGELTVLMISHKFHEVTKFADAVSILRRGKLVGTGKVGELSTAEMAGMMIGDVKLAELDSRLPVAEAAKSVLTVTRVKAPDRSGLKTIEIDALTVRSGEIVGIAGLLGSGRTELLRAMFGADPPEAGEVEVDGKRMPLGSPRKAVQAGLGLLTEDRKTLGLLLELSIRENASLAHLDEISRFWVVDKKKERNLVDHYLGGLKLRAGSWEQPVSSLSGGNQQKVLLARWLATKAKVLFFDEPTKGVDVGAKSEIYKVIGDLAAEGLGVVVVSSYLPEVLGLADRVVVMREGGVAGELPARGTTEEDVLRLASPGAAAHE